jgi:hypothetical protein
MTENSERKTDDRTRSLDEGQDLHLHAFHTAMKAVGDRVTLAETYTQSIYIACGGIEGATSVLAVLMGRYLQRKGHIPEDAMPRNQDTMLFASLLAVAGCKEWEGEWRGRFKSPMHLAYELFEKATGRKFPEAFR